MSMDWKHEQTQLAADRHRARAKTTRARWQRIVLRVSPDATFWVETDEERSDRRTAKMIDNGGCGVGSCLNLEAWIQNHGEEWGTV